MGAAGQQMMLQQQQQQQRQQQGQQRPPSQNNPPNGQVQRMIYEALSNSTPQQLSGWQSAVLIQERISLIWNMSVSTLATKMPQRHLIVP